MHYSCHLFMVQDDPICVNARKDGKTLVTGLWVDHSYDVRMPVDPTSVSHVEAYEGFQWNSWVPTQKRQCTLPPRAPSPSLLQRTTFQSESYTLLSLSLSLSLSLIMLISNANSYGISFTAEPPRFSEDIDCSCSTPFVSTPSRPGHAPSGYLFSAPTSPMHSFIISNHKTKTSSSSSDSEPVFLSSDFGSFEFEFSSRDSPNVSGGGIASMTSADELFLNG
ncbi:hypothetical protein BUALT_BualtUnG0036900 [Buddleja alternifolia]|uniref:Uncharacterized protein n=1 Tax=Buddleja alternifolia TaxID=168488 RepID=A0AAV6W0R9_9LAMI|nr:hypothetical protein BUALT_BualtUnG0036900 [Buddleja alternifolia]